MNRIPLDLMPLERFGALSLRDKNIYLQALADSFCEKTDRPAIELDKGALARLRRFYSRRSLADLKVGPEPTTALEIALRGLGEAVS